MRKGDGLGFSKIKILNQRVKHMNVVNTQVKQKLLNSNTRFPFGHDFDTVTLVVKK